jgi:hypothetical protein
MNEAASIVHWPDSLDATVTLAFFGAVGLLIGLGYVFMVLDFRAYLRSLRRALVKVVRYFPDIPEWARPETPLCLTALGLRMPCNEEDLKRAYRKRVKKLHPDRGGDQKKFLRLQTQFEEALNILRQQSYLRSGPADAAPEAMGPDAAGKRG